MGCRRQGRPARGFRRRGIETALYADQPQLRTLPAERLNCTCCRTTGISRVAGCKSARSIVGRPAVNVTTQDLALVSRLHEGLPIATQSRHFRVALRQRAIRACALWLGRPTERMISRGRGNVASWLQLHGRNTTNGQKQKTTERFAKRQCREQAFILHSWNFHGILPASNERIGITHAPSKRKRRA